MKRTSINLPPPQAKWVRAKAKKGYVSISAVIREIIAEKMADGKPESN